MEAAAVTLALDYRRVDIVRRLGGSWSAREDDLVRALYPNASWDVLRAAFPGRTKPSIEARATALSVTRRIARGRPWSDRENTTLRNLFSKATWAELERSLPGRTRAAIDTQGARLGLRRPIRSEFKARFPLLRKLHEARRAARISRVELAETIGISLVQLTRWERGLNVPKFRSLLDWIEALGLEIDLAPLDRRTRMPWRPRQ